METRGGKAMRIEVLPNGNIEIHAEHNIDHRILTQMQKYYGGSIPLHYNKEKRCARARMPSISEEVAEARDKIVLLWNEKASALGLATVRTEWSDAKMRNLGVLMKNNKLDTLLSVVNQLEMLDFHVNTWGGITLWWLMSNQTKLDGLLQRINKEHSTKTVYGNRKNSDVL